MLTEARERAEAFAERYRGRVAELDVAELAEAMHELAEIHDLGGRAGSYAVLSYSLDTADPARGALLQKARELGAAIETQLLFFDLEWNLVPDERAEELLAAPELAFAAHHLRTLRRYRPHQLSEPEERVLTETNVTGGSAFQRLFTEQTSALEVPLPDRDEPASLEEGLSRLQDPDRERRAEAAAAVTESLRPGLRTRAFVFNTLLQDKATKDRLRGYPHWLASRNLANEASDESVQALIEAVQGRYDLARRWYALKARLLGLDRLAYYDRMAPVSDSDDRIPYGEAEEIVLDCYRTFSPELGEVATEFFTGGYIDGPPRPSKRGGAFCSYTVPSAHPYVMLNYTSRPHDVLVMAHELGHGVHASLARPQGIYHFSTPLTLAETASIFGENIVLERLLERAPGPGRAARPARRRTRRRRGRGVPPDRDEPLRGRDPHGAARGGRAVGGALRRALARHAERPARRQRGARRRLRALVVLHLALRGRAGLRVRLRVRPPARAVGLPPLRGARARASCPPTWTC